MSYRTTIGTSLFVSGLVTIALVYLPGRSLWWGIGMLIVGLVVLFYRQ